MSSTIASSQFSPATTATTASSASATTAPPPSLHCVAVLSLLHELPGEGSLNIEFRGAAVIDWTLRRLARSARVNEVRLIGWVDQLERLGKCAADAATKLNIEVVSAGARKPGPQMQAATASLRWADGWRGGLLGTTAFDAGFDFDQHRAVAANCDVVVLIDPASALLDANLVDALIEKLEKHPAIPMTFAPGSPGAAGMAVRSKLVEELATAKLLPGSRLTYHPDRLSGDPIGRDSAIAVPTNVARTTRRLTIDSRRQHARISLATQPMNGSLGESDAKTIIERLQGTSVREDSPREVCVELTTRRATAPIWWPVRAMKISRPDMSLATAGKLFREMARSPDVRLTLAGVGDPMCHPRFIEIVELAQNAGIRAIHVETDLLPEDGSVIERMVQIAPDIVSIHIPACTAETYRGVMGVDRLGDVIANIKRLIISKLESTRGVPIVVPTLMKCETNLAELETWYDQWLRAVGSAVIAGPSDYSGRIPFVGVSDMAPSQRRACRRLASRISVLSDGRVVSCEQDVTALQSVDESDVQEAWTHGAAKLFEKHAAGQWAEMAVCAACRMWDRP